MGESSFEYEMDRPHTLHVLMPVCEYRQGNQEVTINVSCTLEHLEDLADRVRLLPDVSIPPSHKALWTSPTTGKPYLSEEEPLINLGIRDGDTLKLFFFAPSWPGFEKLRAGEYVEPTTMDVV
mmetsp:Transcript_7435/g.17999  ORF Transcript_7435/g.17999 Transcript_7435/m.17999 type:complete len:123 (-) Transcript_7435:138-506(-)